MLEILRVDTAGDARHARVVNRDGARVGSVTDETGDVRYVSVHPDAPGDTLDVLDWEAGADRVRLPDRLVADDGDVVRLVV